MNFFKSLQNWIKSKSRRDLIKNDNHTNEYLSLNNIDGLTVVILKNHKVLSKEDPKREIYNEVDACSSESEIIRLFTSIDIPDDKLITINDLEVFKNHPEFRVDGDKVYVKDVNIVLDPLILAEFIEILEKIENNIDKEENKDKYSRLMNFWLQIVNSPLKSRENVLLYCKQNDIKLSKGGNIIAYRSAHLIYDPLRSFIKQSFKKVKGWKKSPNKFDVYKDVDKTKYTICINNKVPSDKDSTWEYVGNLGAIKAEHDAIPEKMMFTSNHNFGKYTFGIGDVYKMEGEDPNPNLNNCSSGGLHAANVNYDYNSFGDTKLVVLVSPMKAIYVPEGDCGKFRTSEMKIACVNPNDRCVHISERLIEDADREYTQYTTEQLKEIVRTKDLSDISMGELVPEVSLIDIENITKILEKRVKTI